MIEFVKKELIENDNNKQARIVIDNFMDIYWVSFQRNDRIMKWLVDRTTSYRPVGKEINNLPLNL